MKNVIYIAFTLLLCFAAYKLGDKHGYEEGYQVGYTYDCREDIKALQRVTNALQKSVNSAREQVVKVQSDNARLRGDSMKFDNYREDFQRKADSIHQAKMKMGYPDLTKLYPQNIKQ